MPRSPNIQACQQPMPKTIQAGQRPIPTVARFVAVQRILTFSPKLQLTGSKQHPGPHAPLQHAAHICTHTMNLISCSASELCDDHGIFLQQDPQASFYVLCSTLIISTAAIPHCVSCCNGSSHCFCHCIHPQTDALMPQISWLFISYCCQCPH